jgi:hypothetical protein
MDMPAMDEALHLAALLVSRLCHDLSSPLNGLTVSLGDLGDATSDAPERIEEAQQAADSLAQRLILLRAAWGEAGEAQDAAALQRHALGLRRRNLAIAWGDLLTARPFAAHDARVLLNVLILASEGLPRGGTIALARDGADGVIVMIDGPQAGWPKGLAGLIADPGAAHAALLASTPRQIQAPLTVLLAHAGGQRMAILMSANAEQAPPLRLQLAHC